MEHPDQADQAQPEPKSSASPDAPPLADVKPDAEPKPSSVSDPFDV
jgi:hypothetical protein